MLLSENNIKAELSYAYLHAIAARAGFSCQAGDRDEDGIGVDAKIRAYQTVSIPMDNLLSVAKLRELMARFSRREVINYDA